MQKKRLTHTHRRCEMRIASVACPVTLRFHFSPEIKKWPYTRVIRSHWMHRKENSRPNGHTFRFVCVCVDNSNLCFACVKVMVAQVPTPNAVTNAHLSLKSPVDCSLYNVHGAWSVWLCVDSTPYMGAPATTIPVMELNRKRFVSIRAASGGAKGNRTGFLARVSTRERCSRPATSYKCELTLTQHRTQVRNVPVWWWPRQGNRLLWSKQWESNRSSTCDSVGVRCSRRVMEIDNDSGWKMITCTQSTHL